MTNTFDRKPIDRREYPVDAREAREEEPITEQIEGRREQLQQLRSQNEVLASQVVSYERFLAARAAKEHGNQEPRASGEVGGDVLPFARPEAAKEPRREIHEQSVDKTDLQSVARLFESVIRQMIKEGRTKKSIDDARAEFAKAVAFKAQHQGEKDPHTQEKNQSQWERLARRAFTHLPLSRETISWDAPDAKKLDVPEADRQYIDQERTHYMGVDGKDEPFVSASVDVHAPADAQRRFYVAREEARIQRLVDTYGTKGAELDGDASLVFEKAASLNPIDQAKVSEAMMSVRDEISSMRDELSRAADIYRKRMANLEKLSDADIEGHDAIHDALDGLDPNPAEARAHQRYMAALARFEPVYALMPKE